MECGACWMKIEKKISKQYVFSFKYVPDIKKNTLMYFKFNFPLTTLQWPDIIELYRG